MTETSAPRLLLDLVVPGFPGVLGLPSLRYLLVVQSVRSDLHGPEQTNKDELSPCWPGEGLHASVKCAHMHLVSLPSVIPLQSWDSWWTLEVWSYDEVKPKLHHEGTCIVFQCSLLMVLTMGPGGPDWPGGPFKPCSPFRNIKQTISSTSIWNYSSLTCTPHSLSLTAGPGIPLRPWGPCFPGWPWPPTGPVFPMGPSKPRAPWERQKSLWVSEAATLRVMMSQEEFSPCFLSGLPFPPSPASPGGPAKCTIWKRVNLNVSWQYVDAVTQTWGRTKKTKQERRMFDFTNEKFKHDFYSLSRGTKPNQPFGQEIQMVLVLRSLRGVPGKHWRACERPSPSWVKVRQIDRVHDAATHWFSRLSCVSLGACKTINTLQMDDMNLHVNSHR